MHTKKEPSIEQIRDFVATMNREKLLSLHQEARLVPAERWAKYSGAELPAAALAALRVQTPTISPDEAAARIPSVPISRETALAQNLVSVE